MAESETESTQAAPIIENGSSIQAETSNVAKFAALLKAERLEQEGDLPEPSQEPAATPKPKAAKSESSTEIDMDALKDAFLAGDARKMAELLGENPEDTKVGNTRWAEFRRATRAKEQHLAAEREAIEAERKQVQAERQQLVESSSVLNDAARHLQNEDYASFLETATGKRLEDVLEILTKELIDPSQKEIRKLRAERESERRAKTQQEQAWQKQQQEREAQHARQQYMSELRRDLESDDASNDFLAEYGDEFLQAVFYVQSQSWDGTATISARKAAQQVIDSQTKKHTRFSSLLDKRGGKQAPSKSSGDAKSRTVQGHSGARLSPRSTNVSKSQGGASATPRHLSKQEEAAYWASQFARENASRVG